MSIKHLICDWDETLVHTLPTIKNGYASVYKHFGMNTKSLDEIKNLTAGKPKSEVFSYMLFGANYNPNKSNILKTKKQDKIISPEEATEISTKAAQIFYDYINKNHLKDMSVMEGALDFLNYCKKQNINLYVLSNKDPKYLQAEIKAAGMNNYFKNTYGSPIIDSKATPEEIKKLKLMEKPYTASFKALFNNTPPKAEECCVVGDGTIDVVLAQNIGCPAIIINHEIPGGISKISKAIERLEALNQRLEIDRLPQPLLGE